MIMFLLFDCAKITSISALSLSVSENVKTVALSSLLSLRPNRAPGTTIISSTSTAAMGAWPWVYEEAGKRYHT